VYWYVQVSIAKQVQLLSLVVAVELKAPALHVLGTYRKNSLEPAIPP